MLTQIRKVFSITPGARKEVREILVVIRKEYLHTQNLQQKSGQASRSWVAILKTSASRC